MAKYSVTRACGHEETVVLFGKIKNREWRLENVEPQKLCSECYHAELKRRHEEENREAAEAAREMGLPSLTGTEKQVAWAESIRQQLLADIDEFIYRQVKAEHRNDPKLLEAVEKIRSKTEARWWIDHRGMNMAWELRHLLEEAAKEVKEEKLQPPPEVVAEARVEATIRPEEPVTETVAEIRALDDAVEIDFPERRDDFWEIVKKQLKMEWTGKFWRRKLNNKNGTPIDRVAEAGHRLLAAGFPIRIYDAELRRKAVAGEYESECTRWIAVRIKGDYIGWFAISWDRDREDFYKVARAIGGSRWDKPSVVVPPEKFEEVLDFAQMYGFKLSDDARELAEAARVAKEKTLVAKVEPPSEQAKAVVDRKPPILEVPQKVDIADEFIDVVIVDRHP